MTGGSAFQSRLSVGGSCSDVSPAMLGWMRQVLSCARVVRLTGRLRYLGICITDLLFIQVFIMSLISVLVNDFV